MRRRSSRVKSGPGAEYPSSGTIQLTMLVQNNRRTEARILEWNIGECHWNFREIKRKGRPNPCVSDFMVSGANFENDVRHMAEVSHFLWSEIQTLVKRSID